MFSYMLLTAILSLLRISMALPSMSNIPVAKNLVLGKRLISVSSGLVRLRCINVP